MYYEGYDMIGQLVRLPSPPKRIVSLVPSQTELLYDLGLDEEVVGITKFCVHPESWYRIKKRVGGTKTVSIDAVRALKPDLIIANKEENVREQVEALSNLFPIWTSDIKDIDGALSMINSVARLTNRPARGAAIVSSVLSGLARLRNLEHKDIKVAYYIWRKPWMCAGSDTFISNILSAMGWENVVKEPRYPEIPPNMLTERQVALVLLSSEPYPFSEKHIKEIEALLPQTRILLVDGEMFSWYGSRLVPAMSYLKELLNTSPRNDPN